jgi:murein DD-endopeptidase MepM/ murein hydrolase activator NlpD
MTNTTSPANFRPLIAAEQGISGYCLVDLSVSNPEVSAALIQTPADCEAYLALYCQKRQAAVAYGGYLENRQLDEQNSLFQQGEARSLHLGVDFWCAAHNAVVAPFSGRIHSFANNRATGDYGPTLIIEHRRIWGETPFEGYSLYGHLAESSMASWQIGKSIQQGEWLAKLGVAEENGGYAPHLHFQLMLDLEGKRGDYPGVCAPSDRERFQQNCPDPLPLLGLSHT